MLKRTFDVAVAAVFLVMFLPVLAVVALLIRLWIGTPVLFRQCRPGLKGALFTLVKFRTMTDARDRDGTPLPDAHRMTRLGKVLRASSIDELPELWNVLKGDMSLVGPRPLLPEYLPLYSSFEARRHEVRPGLTGWAQVHGRNAIGWEQRFALDVWYVDHRSFWIDLQILWMTVAIVFRRHGIAASGEATMPPFAGSRRPGR